MKNITTHVHWQKKSITFYDVQKEDYDNPNGMAYMMSKYRFWLSAGPWCEQPDCMRYHEHMQCPPVLDSVTA